MAKENPFLEFARRYGYDAHLFVVEVLGATPDDYQKGVLDAVSRGERYVSIRSGHGVGKTTVLAWLIIWHITCKFPQKTLCTAPTSGQLFDALAAETKSWIKRLPATLQELFDIKQDAIVLRAAQHESFVSFKTSRPEMPEALAGEHSVWMLLIADEASGVHEQVFEASSGSMSGQHATMVLAGNPVRTEGLFFDTHNKPELRGTWKTFHISCVGHPRVTTQFVEEMKDRYGEESNAYRVRVLGEFPKEDGDSVIPYELVALAKTRDVRGAPEAKEVWGLDCGKERDPSALARRKANVLVEEVTLWQGLDTMQIVGRVKALYDSLSPKEQPEAICVDAIGIGAGVADRLRELGLPSRSINVSELPAMKARFRNLKAELWWDAREWFVARDCSIARDMVGKDKRSLADELTLPKMDFTSSGKMFVESKDDIKARGFPSPNRAEAFILTFGAGASTALFGGGGLSWNKPVRRKIGGIV